MSNYDLGQVRKNLDAIISKGHHGYSVFEDWIGLMFFAFQRDDPKYLEIMGKYRNTEPMGKRPADYFAGATASVMRYMRATNEESLGEGASSPGTRTRQSNGCADTSSNRKAMLQKMVKKYQVKKAESCNSFL